MPRRRREKPVDETPTVTPISETPNEMVESGKLKPASKLPATVELSPPEREIISRPGHPDRPAKSWAETLRGKIDVRNFGVRHVTTVSPDMVGLQFKAGMERTAEEKQEMEEIGLRFFNEAKAWLKVNKGDAFEETEALAHKFIHRREQIAGEYGGREG